MPEFKNDAGTIVFRLELCENQWLDVDPGRPDGENWVPFSLSLTVNGQEAYTYPPSSGATFTLFELKGLIGTFRNLVKIKADGQTTETFEFATLEAFFELDVWDTLEPDSLYLAIWINVGTLTDGQLYGYFPGYKFGVSLAALKDFADALDHQLQQILLH